MGDRWRRLAVSGQAHTCPPLVPGRADPLRPANLGSHAQPPRSTPSLVPTGVAEQHGHEGPEVVGACPDPASPTSPTRCAHRCSQTGRARGTRSRWCTCCSSRWCPTGCGCTRPDPTQGEVCVCVWRRGGWGGLVGTALGLEGAEGQQGTGCGYTRPGPTEVLVA